jgi:DNA polymerase III epsilon subunit-like protein
MKKKTGYTLEVDLEIPQSLHDETNDYPLAPHHKNIQEEEISSYSKKCLKDTNTKFMKKNRKLCATLEEKKNYVVHIGILQYYISKGAILKKIHRGIKYTQDDWLKTYIDFNTNERSKSTSEAEKSFYKLMNNAVFGKTMENVRDRKNYIQMKSSLVSKLENLILCV